MIKRLVLSSSAVERSAVNRLVVLMHNKVHQKITILIFYL